MISNQLATWLLIVGLVILVCAWGFGAWWLSVHPETREFDEMDRERDAVNRALSRSRRHPIGSVR